MGEGLLCERPEGLCRIFSGDVVDGCGADGGLGAVDADDVAFMQDEEDGFVDEHDPPLQQDEEAADEQAHDAPESPQQPACVVLLGAAALPLTSLSS